MFGYWQTHWFDSNQSTSTRQSSPAWKPSSYLERVSVRFRKYKSDSENPNNLCIFRNERTERSQPNREPARPSASDAVAALSYPASRPGGQIWTTFTHAATSKNSSCYQDWGCVFPENHRKHAHGESFMWHVQKLNDFCELFVTQTEYSI